MIQVKSYDDILKEAEFTNLDFSAIDVFRDKFSSGMESSLAELQELKSKISKQQMDGLLQQCTTSAINAINGQFGLASAILGSKDGGNVNTTHNVRKGIYASQAEKDKYDNREVYSSEAYHSHPEYIRQNKVQGEVYKRGEAVDYMTGKKLNPHDKADLDHIVSAKTVHDDRARVLAGISGPDLANTEQNLAKTDASLNRAKKAKTAEEFLSHRDERLAKLDKIKSERPLNQNEQKELENLKKQKEINDQEFIDIYNKNKKEIDKKIDKKYYTSLKPYKETLATGTKDAAKMAIHSAIGIIFREFFVAIVEETKILFKNFGNESLKDILKRFKSRLDTVWADIKSRWKDIIAGSFEVGIQAFFSNLIVFVINVFFTTLKSIVRIIRAGFTSLWSACKIIVNPPQNMPSEDVIFEASKVFVSGVISALSMLASESIKTWLLTIPGLNAILILQIPLSPDTIGDALSLSISAAMGAVLSTIAVYYMDKFRNDSKQLVLEAQIMTKGNEVAQYKTALAMLDLADAWRFEAMITSQTFKCLENDVAEIKIGKNELDNDLEETNDLLAKLNSITKGMKK